MTKLIAALIIVIVLYGGWQLFFYWEKVKNEEEAAQKQSSVQPVDPRSLSGLPQRLEATLEAAQKEGVTGMRNWFKMYGHIVQDPRKAWVELDYCVLIAREDPAEAKRIFASVKSRTPSNSPIWPRIKQLEKTYQ
jgi:hypothetical protein